MSTPTDKYCDKFLELQKLVETAVNDQLSAMGINLITSETKGEKLASEPIELNIDKFDVATKEELFEMVYEKDLRDKISNELAKNDFKNYEQLQYHFLRVESDPRGPVRMVMRFIIEFYN